MIKNHYAALHIPLAANTDAIKTAYRQLARKYHPDVKGDADATKFAEIADAYQILSDAERRRVYDIEFLAYVKKRGWVLCPQCSAHNDVPHIPPNHVPKCGRCRAELPISESERRSKQTEALREQAIEVAADLGSEVLDIAGDYFHTKIQGLRSRFGIARRKGA